MSQIQVMGYTRTEREGKTKQYNGIMKWSEKTEAEREIAILS
jgi:exonuclease III